MVRNVELNPSIKIRTPTLSISLLSLMARILNSNKGGRKAPEFEPLIEKEKVEAGDGEVDTRIEKLGTANGKIIGCKAKGKNKTCNIQKYSNHIEFIDYIPTHEVITYRHLFAYGFYVV